MIYISSSCSKKETIKESILDLVEFGFKNIELSGGTRFYSTIYEDLCELKNKYNLNYRLHNYFPPPERSFVLNLASSNESVLSQSRKMVIKAIEYSALLNSPNFGMHAGFRISPNVEELGQKIEKKSLTPYNESLTQFFKEFSELSQYGKTKGVTLLLENNVFSHANFQSFGGENPFFLTGADEYLEMSKHFPFPLLLDVAHLKVSCETRRRDFSQDMNLLIPISPYIHLSDNDKLSDSNNELKQSSDVFQILSEHNLKDKTFTIEVYDGLESVVRCQNLLSKLL